jgi:hypothetical protein
MVPPNYWFDIPRDKFLDPPLAGGEPERRARGSELGRREGSTNTSRGVWRRREALNRRCVAVAVAGGESARLGEMPSLRGCLVRGTKD